MRIVPRLPQQLEVRDEERGPVGGERARRRVHELEEPRDILSLLLGQQGLGLEVLREELRAVEKLVQQLGGGELRRPSGVVGKVIDQSLRGCNGLRREGALRRGDLGEDLPQRLLPAATRFSGGGQLDYGESVERRDRQEVDVSRVRGQRDGREERNEEPDLLSLVELAAAGKVRGDLPVRERIEEGRRVVVVAHQDREVAVSTLPPQGFARDQVRDLVGLVDEADVLEVVDLDLPRGRPPDEVFLDSERRL